MAKCSRCGKSGLFLSLSNGLCKSCSASVKPAPKKKSPYEPITKTKAVYVDIVPSDPTITEKSFIYTLNCVLDGDRVRVDRSRNSPIGYLPEEMAELAMRGHVQSVHFDSFVTNDVSGNRVPLRIKLRIWLVPSDGTIPEPPPDPLDVERGSKWIYPKVIDDCSIAYWYPSVPVTVMNRTKLREMVIAKNSFGSVDASVEVSADGNIALSSDGIIIAYLRDRQQMCQDWLNKQFPLRCCFSSFKKGEETVALAFYRDDRQKYTDCKSAVVKLTAFKAEEAQFAISEMKGPEKLKVNQCDGFHVTDIYNENIGKLPAKYQRMYEDDTVDAVYFDHFDVLEDDEGENTYVPYVKIFFD